MAPPKLVTVYRSQGMLPAQAIRAKLESAGLPVFLKYEAVGQVLGLTVDGLGLVEVQVPSEYAEDAAALLVENTGEEESLEEAELEATWPDEALPDAAMSPD